MTQTQIPADSARTIQGQIFDLCVTKRLIPEDSWNLGTVVLAHAACDDDGELREMCSILKPTDMSYEQLETLLEHALADVRQRRGA